MPDSPETITVHGHGPAETIYGVLRSIACTVGFCFIAHIDHSVSRYAIGGIVVVASPSLARAVIAPFLAKILRNMK